MLDLNKKQFAQIVRSTILVTGGEAPEPDVLRIWWAALQAYDLAVVSAAFSEYAMRGKYAPKPADILAIIDRLLPDGRLGADEAWAMIPRDEYTSVVMTEEMAEAYGIALPLLNEGDAIAARMTFKQAYERIVDDNKRKGIAAKWFPSLGRDPEMRAVALAEAVRLGRLGVSHAAGLLAPVQSAVFLDSHKPLTAIEDKQITPEVARENLIRLRDMLAKKPIGMVIA